MTEVSGQPNKTELVSNGMLGQLYSSSSSEVPKTEVPKTVYLTDGKPHPGRRMTYEEFLEWVDEDTHAEWVDGEVIVTSPASIRHQNIKGFLETVMRTFAEAFNRGLVLSAGTQMRLPTAGREPDVLFFRQNRLHLLHPTYFDGPADIAVEIVSPESIERDRETKLAEYRAGGVLEYWLIDATEDSATFYRSGQNGQYEVIPLDAEGRYHSVALEGFWLRPTWLWQTQLPDVLTVLRTVGGTAFVDYFNQQAL